MSGTDSDSDSDSDTDSDTDSDSDSVTDSDSDSEFGFGFGRGFGFGVRTLDLLGFAIVFCVVSGPWGERVMPAFALRSLGAELACLFHLRGA
ncbi:MAG: hypothetical protein IPK60_03885 [Sandaracinaceae bacterium]|nr:hypothetical protein [Sandaracinaceae bacterium]